MKITKSTNLHIKFSMHVICRYIFDDIQRICTYLRVFLVGYHPESVSVSLTFPNWRFRWIMTRFSPLNSFTNAARAAVMCNEAPSNCCCCKIKSSFCCNPRWCQASCSHNHWCQAFCVVCSGGSHSFLHRPKLWLRKQFPNCFKEKKGRFSLFSRSCLVRLCMVKKCHTFN